MEREGGWKGEGGEEEKVVDGGELRSRREVGSLADFCFAGFDPR